VGNCISHETPARNTRPDTQLFSSGNNLEGVFEEPFFHEHVAMASVKGAHHMGREVEARSSQKTIAQQIARRKFPAGGMSN
jgi:hypothetical protein